MPDILLFSTFSKFTVVKVKNASASLLGENGQNFRSLGWLVFEISVKMWIPIVTGCLRPTIAFRPDTTVVCHIIRKEFIAGALWAQLKLLATHNFLPPNLWSAQYNCIQCIQCTVYSLYVLCVYQDLSHDGILAGRPGAWLVKTNCFICRQSQNLKKA